jgi:hypothetical protein
MKPQLSSLLLVATIIPHAFAGGWFIISLGQPSASSDSVGRRAAFTVRVYGCSAKQAQVVARAEGLVDGQRRSIELKPVLLPGRSTQVHLNADSRVVEGPPQFTVAVPKEWPTDGGVWVIRVSAVTPWRQQSALVALSQEDGVNREATLLKDSFSPDEIEGQLRKLAKGAVAISSQ